MKHILLIAAILTALGSCKKETKERKVGFITFQHVGITKDSTVTLKKVEILIMQKGDHFHKHVDAAPIGDSTNSSASKYVQVSVSTTYNDKKGKEVLTTLYNETKQTHDINIEIQ